jgi:glycosyltransferase involved in cell wall biosynthesis
MRIAILVARLPYPPAGGGDLRNYQHIEALRTLGKVLVLCFEEPDGRTKNQQHDLPEYRAIVPNSRWRWVRRIGRVNKPLRRMIEQLDGFRVRWPTRRKVARELNAFKPDLIVLEELKCALFMPRVRVKVVYDAHNIESMLREQLTGGRPVKGLVDGQHTLAEIRRIERDIVCNSEQVWVCSKDDLGALKKLYGTVKDVRVIPNCIDVEKYEETYKLRLNKDNKLDLSSGPTLLYSSVMNYKPNADAVFYFIDDILPLVRDRFPNVRLVLCGRGPTEAMLKAAERDGAIIVTGEVPDTRPYFERCDIVVVPLRQGSGTRFKILEALAMGCPVVSTSKGAEGLEMIDGQHLLIADTPREFVKQLERCVADSALVKTLMTSGRKMAQQTYSGTVGREAVIASIRSIHE